MTIELTAGEWSGLIGGLVGSAIGVAGGVFGTWNSLRHCRGPAERAFVRRACVWAWGLSLLFVAGLLLIPKPWGWMLWILYGPLLFWGIRSLNAGQYRARVADGTLTEEEGVGVEAATRSDPS